MDPPGAQGKNTVSSANHGRVQLSIRLGIAAHMAAAPDDNSPLRYLSRQRTLCPMHSAGWTELSDLLPLLGAADLVLRADRREPCHPQRQCGRESRPVGHAV